MTKIIKSLLALSLSAAAGLAVSPAIAQSPGQTFGYEPVTIEFRYRSWETPAKNYQALRRIARNSCTSLGPRLMVTRISEQKCADALTDSAVAELGRRTVSELHFAATGRRVSAGPQLASGE